MKHGRSRPRAKQLGAGTAAPPRASSTGPRPAAGETATAPSLDPRPRPRRARRASDSGDTSTSDEPTLMLSDRASGSPPPRRASRPGTVGKNAGSTTARGAAPGRDQAGDERHGAVHGRGSGQAREQAAEQLHPAGLLDERHERAHAGHHQDGPPGDGTQGLRLVGGAEYEEARGGGERREAHGQAEDHRAQRPRRRSPRTTAAAARRAARRRASRRAPPSVVALRRQSQHGVGRTRHQQVSQGVRGEDLALVAAEAGLAPCASSR